MEEKLESKGMGRHIQMQDTEAVNFSDPIPQRLVLEGKNMAEQARKSGRVVGTGWNIIGNPF